MPKIETMDGFLTPAQARVVDALVAGCTIKGAAEEAGVDRSTVHRWFHDRQFVDALSFARNVHSTEIRGQLQSLARDAVQALAAVLNSDRYSPVLRVRIAQQLLRSIGVDRPIRDDEGAEGATEETAAERAGYRTFDAAKRKGSS